MKHVETRDAGSVLILKPRRNLMGGDECEELREAANQALERGNRRLVIDLAGVDYLNSTGIGELAGIYASYQKREGRVVLANLHKKVKEVLVLVRLVRIFDIYESVEEAIASFATPPAEPETK